MFENTRPPVSATTRSLPSRYYTDPALFTRELERVFYEMWLHVGRVEDVARPGEYLMSEIGSESVLIVRDREGELRAFYNVCRHRGTRLCEDSHGSFSGAIQCPYHAWTYELDGRLRSAPHMEKVEGFRETDYPLRGVSVDTWDGHVFVNLAKAPAPLPDHLLDLPERLSPWGMESLVRVHRERYLVAANWKLIIQNYSECLHCPVAHPLLNRLSHFMSGENAPPRKTYLGGAMDLRAGARTLSMDGLSPWARLPGLGDAEARKVLYYAVLPNLLLNLQPDYMVTFSLWPVAFDRTRVECEWHFHRDEVAKPAFDPKKAVEFWDLTNRQDWHLSELAQLGIGSRAYEPGPYSNREELLPALDRLIKERVD